jgi:hypothetical protein
MPTSLKAAADCLYATLTAAQKERAQRPDLVDGPDGPECEWAVYERPRMHGKVNELRTERGLPAVPVEEIIRVERLAAGHVDYSLKFAFYCAELADAWPPASRSPHHDARHDGASPYPPPNRSQNHHRNRAPRQPPVRSPRTTIRIHRGEPWPTGNSSVASQAASSSSV